jgi:hypothetical protein
MARIAPSSRLEITANLGLPNRALFTQASIGVSTIALFGKADPHRTGPVGKGKIVYFRQDDPSDIQADEGIEAAKELLQST